MYTIVYRSQERRILYKEVKTKSEAKQMVHKIHDYRLGECEFILDQGNVIIYDVRPRIGNMKSAKGKKYSFKTKGIIEE